MKIHFVIPPAKKPVDRDYGCNYAFFMQHNVVLLEIATLLRDNGFEIEITDSPVDGIPLDKINEADAYVFYSVALTRDVDINAAKYLEKKSKYMIFIGPDPTWEPKAYLLKPNWFVVRGEPDFGLLDLVKNIKHPEKVKGVSYLKDKKIVNNMARELSDLNKIPIPDRNLLKNPYKYINPQLHKYPATTMLTSRGCAYRCYYCVPNSLSYAREIEWKRYCCGKKPKVGIYPTERVIKEFEEIKRLGYKSIKILDDQLLWDKERNLEIFRAIKDFGFEIACLARADHLLDKDVVKAMAEAGVKYIDIGLESFNQEILDYIHKDLKVETFYKAIENLREVGIDPEINILIASCPLETKETIKDTLKKARSLGVEVIHVKACAAFPGTEFHKLAKENGWILTKDYVAHDASKETYTSYPHLPKEYIEGVVKKEYLRHYFNPKFLVKEFVKIKSFKELRDKAITAKNILTR